MPRICILGAGPAGVGAAYGLARKGLAPTLVERAATVGGNAGSFDLNGIPVDFGSHRLHPSTDPEILKTLEALMGPDLLHRPRHGRIRLGNRWIHFPLRPLDLALRAPPFFLAGAAADVLRKLGPRRRPRGEESFESVLIRGLGPTVCRGFYFPFARKIWGLEPGEISAVQATRRVSAGTAGRLLSRLLPGRGDPGGKGGRGGFFYPRNGFGQISHSLWKAAGEMGALTHLETTVQEVTIREGGMDVAATLCTRGEDTRDLESPPRRVQGLQGFQQIWSTIPLPALVRLTRPGPPDEVLASAERLRQRALILVYLTLETGRFSEFDAHYFPSPDIPFTRISEPKNYGARSDPPNRTVLCAEIPCSPSDPVWNEGKDELRDRVLEGLALAGLPVPGQVLDTTLRRLPHAYPVYERGFEAHFRRVEEWVDGLPGIISFGRQGLFAHDNTHHALAMAWAAVRCLREDGELDLERWSDYRKAFAEHVVED